MTMPLIQLTKEAHEELEKEGKVRLISEELYVGRDYGMAAEKIHVGIAQIAARDYNNANAYVLGDSQTIERGIVTKFVLYEISG